VHMRNQRESRGGLKPWEIKRQSRGELQIRFSCWTMFVVVEHWEKKNDNLQSSAWEL
jgi:hypothetical protein